ncbi:hypothetical protein D0861_07932 [Hortaea werneckii]|uniref:Cytochrome c oxidase subunit 6, mitochondrial n=1 Tax=Hortaea werneckii TaxID=91943 RepID=A0A3M7F0D6_HORWE|nr:hypothetical protein D0861_07932 [Hortaea werneckii]
MDGNFWVSGGYGRAGWKRRKRFGQVVKEEDKRRIQPVACRQELSCGCCMQTMTAPYMLEAGDSHLFTRPVQANSTVHTRYEKEFENVQDVFELQRNLNNAFAYDLVPSPSVITAALRAARRVNDYPTAVRIFEGIAAKVENRGQYDEYVKELEPIREELGVNLKEQMYPDGTFGEHLGAAKGIE